MNLNIVLGVLLVSPPLLLVLYMLYWMAKENLKATVKALLVATLMLLAPVGLMLILGIIHPF